MSKNRGLGRGLDLLLGAATSREISIIAIDQLHPGRFQPRLVMDETALEGMAQSIREHGVIEPLLARPRETSGYELIAGERRWRAAQKAGLTELPVVVSQLSDEQALVWALVENMQREDLNAMEQARALARLLQEFELTHERAADMLGRSRSAVTNLLRLLELDEQVQQHLAAGELGMGHARALLALSAEQQRSLGQEAVTKALSVREVESRVRHLRSDQEEVTRTRRSTDPKLVQIQKRLEKKLTGLNVRFLPGSKKEQGVVSLRYSSPAELARLLDLLEGEPL